MSENNSKQKDVLAIISEWPSIEHPYLVYLYYHLKLHFPGMRLFLFKKTKDMEFAEKLIGKQGVALVLKNAVYRFEYSNNIFTYIKPIFFILKDFYDSSRIFRECRKAGYSIYQSIGQLLYSHVLVGQKFDLVYINALQTARHFPIRILFQDTPVISSSRGQDFDFAPEGYYDRTLSQLAHLHVLGNYLKAKAVSRNFPSERITIIPPAILPACPASNVVEVTPRPITLVSASRLFWSKGYLYSLRAVRRLVDLLRSETVVRYVIFGDGPELEFMKVEIDRLNLQNVVSLRGWTDQNTINAYLSQCDIYLLLSIEEGFNNSVMQAQQFGLPCVVSNAGGLPENVLHDETGFVVPRYDVETAAVYLRQLVVDENLRKKMGEAAKVRIVKEFSLDKQVDKYVGMFTKAVK